jgi:hypothetical protein
MVFVTSHFHCDERGGVKTVPHTRPSHLVIPFFTVPSTIEFKNAVSVIYELVEKTEKK